MKKLSSLRAAMTSDFVLIAKEADVTWLTGFTGDSSQVLISKGKAYFFTDSRYTEQAQKQLSKDYHIIETNAAERIVQIGKYCSDTLGIDYANTTLAEMDEYRNEICCRFADYGDLLISLRSIKDEAELAAMRSGAKITQDAFYHVLKYFKEGVSEQDIYAELIYYFHKHGAVPSFTPIIASGENSSMPHAGVTDRKFCKGDFITMDFGCIYGGMCTDFTRTVALFGVAEREKIVYNTVAYANAEGLAALKAGITGEEADRAARNIIEKAGFGEYFGHGAGHGVGVEIHEQPRLSRSVHTILQSGMVVTVEPGIYLPGEMGVRIEDMAVITADGCENFYTAEKELIII